jgi:osmotically-inducible protein OsmY
LQETEVEMSRTAALLGAIALSAYGLSAFSQATAPPTGSPQAAAPPTGQPAQEAAATSDEALTKSIRSALDADPNHYFRHVNVRVDNGIANLSGFVWSSQAINRARTIASKVPGVTRVVTSNLTLEPNRPR